MEIDRKELKRQAKEAMGLAQPPFWVVTLVYLLMTSGLSDLMDWLLPASQADSLEGLASPWIFLSILFLLYSTVVNFGFKLWALWTHRRLDPGLGSLTQGFSVAGRVIWMEILIMLQVFLRCLPLAVVAVLALLLYPFGAVWWLVSALAYVACWLVTLRYALAPYLLADHPDDGAGAAVRRSEELMRGWKWELFKLEFSFLGWYILSALLSGVVSAVFLQQSGFFTQLFLTGSLDSQLLSQADQFWPALLSTLAALPIELWVKPYRAVSLTGFYDARLRLQQQSAPPL
jgi:hypothetical protein